MRPHVEFHCPHSDYFQQLVLGMYYCHVHGIAHRDLKPENLMLDETGKLKISDFGLSNLQNTTRSGKISVDLQLHTMCGTPEYVAPEVLMGKGYSGFTADVWSCGVILYVMLCGSLPFRDTEGSSIFSKIKNATYEMKPYLSEESKDMIRHLLVVDPKQRWTLDQVVQHPWFQKGFNSAALEVIRSQALPPPTDEAVASAFVEIEEDQGGENDTAPAYTSEGAVDMLDSLLQHASFHESNFVEKHTTFGIPRTPEDASACVFTALEQLNAHPQYTKDNQYRIKGSLDVPGSILTYNIQLFEPKTYGTTVVEVKKARGTPIDFHDFYRRLLDTLQKLTVTTAVATVVPGGAANTTATTTTSTHSALNLPDVPTVPDPK
eukprot:TRINITY_DN47013_c0_g1_i2.p1 TRINITY_DN47013_c0_g1~~TRINITY_DN47013_c0_g1_i2.p1  ORF type:complete len:377 (+),score=20.65 TRINITY_DN47013_c0_g1_i2:404-1534(+)